MDELKLNYHSSRSQKARISVGLNQNWLICFSILMVALLIAGIALIVMGSPAGWALMGFSVIPAMVAEWYNGELRHLPIAINPKSIDDILSGTILGRLSFQPTPRDVAAVVSGLSGGQFLAARFGVGPQFLQNITSPNSSDMQQVWQEAWTLRNQTGSKNISAVILTIALIKCAPNYQTLLSHLQLDIDDLIDGIKWYDHLHDLINQPRMFKQTGGLARDWSFGWTPLLNHFGQNISQQMGSLNTSLLKLAAHDDSLGKLINIFGKNGRQNAALIGPSGVGKTEIVHAFASSIIGGGPHIPSSLQYRQIFILDSSALIAAAPGRGEIERLITRILNEAYRAKNVIICLDNAQLFFEDGIGSIDVSNIFLPILKAGNLRMILTMDEQRFLEIGQRNPELVTVLNKIMITPATRSETILIMQDRSIVMEFQYRVTYMYQALAEAYRLGERYVHELAMPGKALSLLESAANYNEGGFVTANSVQRAIEGTLGIKVSVSTDIDEREKLLNLEDLIHQRMINQTRAVKVVCDALRRARAGVRNQNRPIGTFLFLGPTGVGKTELAKALADVYFGGENRIIRLDMNEYANSDDAVRLIADSADNANSLTARIIKQPFSVILLDEFEKAHTNVLSTLLQLLDEGILRDAKNREVSFRDAIIIATSNAGADTICEYIERGYDIEQFEDQFVDSLIRNSQFRPELLNRFDEIVVFSPLKKDELLKIVDLMIASVNNTLALQKISVNVDDDAKKYLVEAGYDPRLGARPMRRVVQRAVENNVAKQMLSGTVEPGSVITITLEQVHQIISTKAAADQIVDGSSVI